MRVEDAVDLYDIIPDSNDIVTIAIHCSETLFGDLHKECPHLQLQQLH